ncbi:MAG: ABC transporter permease [Bacteroidota bacterium]
MKSILTVARKEFLDSIRDRRTLIMMIVLPLLLFPAIIFITATIGSAQSKKTANKTLRIALIDNGNAPALKPLIEGWDNTKLVEGITDTAQAAQLIKDDSMELAFVVDPAFDEAIDSLQTGSIQLFHKSTTDDKIKDRGKAILDSFSNALMDQRLATLSLTPENIDPVNIDDDHNVAGVQEVVGKAIGGFLPYIFILFSFMGCMYPAIDLFAGEKERGTLETILTSPVNRLHILFGKMIVVSVSGIITALITLLGMALTVFILPIPDKISGIVADVAQFDSLLVLLAMIIPLAIFFAGVLIPVSIYAKGFKEAQSMIGPMNILVIIPAALGLLPGMELNVGTALIPILNIALSSKEIIAGTINYGLLALVFVSLIALAVGAVALSVNMFGRESNLLRA